MFLSFIKLYSYFCVTLVMLLRSAFISLLVFSFSIAKAQTDIAKLVTLDEFVVSAGLENFDAADFIEQVQKDTTFYQAFLNLKYFPHDIKSAMVVYEKDESERGTLQRKARQFLSTDEKMWVDITYENTNGKIKKRNGDWKYLTADMYDEVFFPTQKQHVDNKIVSKEQELDGSGLEKHKAQLKKMLFNPGQEIENVPFIGDKMAIFDEKMVPFYMYSIYAYNWKDSIPCIAFSCYVKEGLEEEVVIRDMTSYFHRDTHDVIAREYRLAHKTLFFDFDISMKVENKIENGWLLPEKISYSGQWDVPFKKPEIISFQIECSDYLTRAGKYAF